MAGAMRYKDIAKTVGQAFQHSKAIHTTPGAPARPISFGSPSRSTTAPAGLHSKANIGGQTTVRRAKTTKSRLDMPTGTNLTKEDRMRHQLQFLEEEKLSHEAHLRDLNQHLDDYVLQERRARILVDKHQTKVAAHEKKTQVVQMQINAIRKDLHGCEGKLPEERHNQSRLSTSMPAVSMDVPLSSASSSRLGTGRQQHQSSPDLGASGRQIVSPSRGTARELGLNDSCGSLQFSTSAGSGMLQSSMGFRTGSADSQRSGQSQPSITSSFTGLQGALAGRQRASAAAMAAQQSALENEQTLAPFEEMESALDTQTLTNWFASVEEDRRTRYSRNPHAINPDEEAEVVTALRSIQDRHRDIIRSNLVAAAGSEIKAFKMMDFNGSGKICLGDFSGGVDRLGVPWKSIMGTTRPKELFKLFDQKHRGSLTFNDLFPGVNPYVEKDSDGASTPELYRKWCKKMDADPSAMNRKAMWVPANTDEHIKLLSQAQDKLEEVAAAKKRMEAMIKRLKTRGKSSARCRVIAAAHLPAGTGPEDMQGVKTFSQAQVDDLKREYTEKVFETSKVCQNVMFTMRDQHKDLRKARHSLYAVTEEPYQRLALAEEAKAQAQSIASGFGSLVGKVKDPSADQTGMSTGTGTGLLNMSFPG